MADVDTSAEAVERLAVCADEVWADLPQQMGRASMEGHSVGQMLAAHQRGKIGHVAATLRALLAEADGLRASVDRLSAKSDAAMHEGETLRRERDAALASAVAAEGERDRMREALLFYADVRKYPSPLTGGMGALWSDCGIVARTALGTLTAPDFAVLAALASKEPT